MCKRWVRYGSLIDTEHGPISIETAYRMVTAIAGTKAEAWIRVAHNDVALIKAALDTGAKAIVVGCRRSKVPSKYAAGDLSGPIPVAHQHARLRSTRQPETKFWVLIEHPQAIENLDEILAVEGLDGAIAAPLDLAVNMGFTDGPGHPEVQEAIASASKKIAMRGFPLTSFAVTPEEGRLALERGPKSCSLDLTACLFRLQSKASSHN
jgi:2-keto-3-deoxy-L-rhamnonate aldolase RhmA